jgi:hypothetical protein
VPRWTLPRLDNDWLACPPSKWLRLVIRDEHGRAAWTNPIWLEDIGLGLSTAGLETGRPSCYVPIITTGALTGFS